MSEQASPVDQWMNDDDHRYGALRESYVVRVRGAGAGGQEQEHALRLRHLRQLLVVSRARPALEHQRQVSARLDSRTGTTIVAHPDYDDFWKREAWVQPAARVDGSESQRRRLLGSGRSVGAVADLPARGGARSRSHQLHGGRPVVSRQWQTPKGDSIGLMSIGGHETAREFRETIEAPFFRYYLHGEGEKPSWRAIDLPVRLEHVAHVRRVAAERVEAHESLSARGRHALVREARVEPARARIASTSPIRRIRFRIASVRSRRRIRRATGARGRSRISASSTIVPMC